MKLTTLTPKEELVEAARQVMRDRYESPSASGLRSYDISDRKAVEITDEGGRGLLERRIYNLDWLRECLRAYEAGPGPEDADV